MELVWIAIVAVLLAVFVIVVDFFSRKAVEYIERRTMITKIVDGMPPMLEKILRIIVNNRGKIEFKILRKLANTGAMHLESDLLEMQAALTVDLYGDGDMVELLTQTLDSSVQDVVVKLHPALLEVMQ